MLLQPIKTKYKKTRKNKLKLLDYKANVVEHGIYSLKSAMSGHISAKNLESARQAIQKQIKKYKGKLFIKIFPNIPITSKPIEVRMGKGKGAVHHWSSKVSRGTVIFEIIGVSSATALTAFKNATARLPIKTSVILKSITTCNF